MMELKFKLKNIGDEEVIIKEFTWQLVYTDKDGNNSRSFDGNMNDYSYEKEVREGEEER